MSGATSAVTSDNCGTDSSGGGNDSNSVEATTLDSETNEITNTTTTTAATATDTGHNNDNDINEDTNSLIKSRGAKINGNSNINNNNDNDNINNVLANGKTNTSSDIEPHRYRPQKYCAVCGDKAIACNFNAVTCESCKAFFRRNAFKESRLKCLFENKCLIDRVTRRFCSKCRLLKCFQIGMKREWILTDEQKQLKRVKIIQNRQSRTRQQQEDAPAKKSTSIANDSDEDIMTDESYNNNNNVACVIEDETEQEVNASSNNNNKRKVSHSSDVHNSKLERRDNNNSNNNNNNNINQKRTKVVKTQDASTSCPDERDLSLSGSLLNYCSFASQCQYCSLQMNNINNLNVQSNTQPIIGSTPNTNGISLNVNGQQQQQYQQQQQPPLQQPPPLPQQQQQQQMVHGPNGFSSTTNNSQANPLAMSFQQIHPPPPYGAMTPSGNYQPTPYHLQSQEPPAAAAAAAEPAMRPPPSTCCCMSLDGRHNQYHNLASIHHLNMDQFSNCTDQQLRSIPTSCAGAPPRHHYAASNLIQMTTQQVIVSSSTNSLQQTSQQLHPMSNAVAPSQISDPNSKTSCVNGSPGTPADPIHIPLTKSNAKPPPSATYELQARHIKIENPTMISDSGSGSGNATAAGAPVSSADTGAAAISLTADGTDHLAETDAYKINIESPPEIKKLDIKHVLWHETVYAEPASTEPEVRARIDKLDFTEHEYQIVLEMIEATRFIFETRVGEGRRELVTLDDIVQMCDTALRRLIKTVKQIKAFRMLSMDDQIVLLKTACFKILLLRTTFHYQDEVEGWCDVKTGRVMRLDILKRAKKSLVYERHLDLVKKIPEPLRRDRLVLAIMTLILLFDSSNSINLKHSNSVGLDNLLYFSLLRKYLLATQPDPLTKYEALVEALELINACNEEYNVFFSKDFQPEQVTPLLIEIFDISINNSG